MKLKQLLICALAVLVIGTFAACGSEGGVQKDSEAGSSVDTSAAGKDSQQASEPEKSDKVTYTVKLTDEEGNGIANALVQICYESCIPGKTDETGTAVFEVDEAAEYKASLMQVPEGYDYTTEETEFYFGDKSEVTIVLKAQ